MIIVGEILEVANVKFDDIKNRLVIITTAGDKIEIDPISIMKNMPNKNLKERVKKLHMMIHYIDMQQLSQISQVLTKAVKLAEGVQDCRKKMKDCKKVVCIRMWEAISKTYLDEKNILKELRLSVKLLNEKKKEYRTKIAMLGFDPDEKEGK